MADDSPAPVIHPDNVVNRPMGTFAGVALAATTIGNTMTGGVPTNTGGWIQFGMTLAMSLLAAFSRM